MRCRSIASGSTSIGNRRFTNHVGMGSRQQCFDGALVTICNISSVVTSSNADSWQQDLSVIVGGSEFAVHGQTDAIDFRLEEVGKIVSCI